MTTTINITLPDWVDERDVFITAGLELVAVRRAYEKTFNIKTSRCSQCGKCCMNVADNHPYTKGDDGHCGHLKFLTTENKYTCELTSDRPFACCIGEKTEPECSITYKEV